TPQAAVPDIPDHHRHRTADARTVSSLKRKIIRILLSLGYPLVEISGTRPRKSCESTDTVGNYFHDELSQEPN
ncbi:hypothetical protein, partial [Paracoccus sp. (in: a-proteobacteria)]|uniref:hypothetical protein n=1 Tax=Paracoccus sp. TaxID=267 RepID=UPI0028AB6412